MVTTEDNLSGSQLHVIRILNGPFMGCEYPLPFGKVLFVVGKDSVMTDDKFFPVFPDDTFYIPLEQDGVNFEIIADYNAPEGKQLQLKEFRDTGCHTRYFDCNTPVRIGGLGIAVRTSEQTWSTSVLSYPEISGEKKGRKERRINLRYLVLLSVLVIMTISGMMLLWNTQQHKTAEVNALLGDEQYRFKVMSGRNHQYYIFALNEQDRLWARQVVVREGYGDSVQVIDAEEENKRLVKWFDSNYPTLAYYRLHLDNPEIPRLWISRQRTKLNTFQHKRLVENLMVLLPYARSIEVVSVSDETALSQAEEGLKHRNIPFYRKRKGEDLTFMISGELNDAEIFRAREFIQQYNQKWGERYIQFRIELKSNRNKGSSFKYGKYMYEKTAPDVWSFISPQ